MLPQLTMSLLSMLLQPTTHLLLPQHTMLPQLSMLPQLFTLPLPTMPQLFIMLPQHILLLTQLMMFLMTTPRLPSMLKRPMTVLEHPLDLTLLRFPMAVLRLLTTTPTTMMDMLLRLLMKAQLSIQRLLPTPWLMLLPTHWLMLLPTQLPLLTQFFMDKSMFNFIYDFNLLNSHCAKNIYSHVLCDINMTDQQR